MVEDATNWAIQELERFKDFLAVSVSKMMPQPVGVVMQDGGELVANPLSDFPKEVWKDFQKKFLSKKTKGKYGIKAIAAISHKCFIAFL